MLLCRGKEYNQKLRDINGKYIILKVFRYLVMNIDFTIAIPSPFGCSVARPSARTRLSALRAPSRALRRPLRRRFANSIFEATRKPEVPSRPCRLRYGA